MPYIEQVHRERIREGGALETPGELNFAFSEQIQNYMTNRPLNYRLINDIIGALEGAKLEFYRRVAADYEDKAIERNGDVY